MSKSPGTIVQISPSPSPSPSCNSSSDNHDHAAPPRPSPGVEMLGRLAVRRDSPRHGRSREILVLGHPDEVVSRSSGIKELQIPPPFAEDAHIRGWKVVGGKTWTDKAKLGSYVVYDIEITLHSVSHTACGVFHCNAGLTSQGGEMNIMRRYTDFVNLRRSLLDAYPVSASLKSHGRD